MRARPRPQAGDEIERAGAEVVARRRPALCATGDAPGRGAAASEPREEAVAERHGQPDRRRAIRRYRRNSRTSAIVGMPARPPSARHLRAATADAKRRFSRSSYPSAMP